MKFNWEMNFTMQAQSKKNETTIKIFNELSGDFLFKKSWNLANTIELHRIKDVQENYLLLSKKLSIL